ncbi:MAG: DNA-primase RepB domain-containing protein [Acidobacteriota bacterium]
MDRDIAPRFIQDNFKSTDRLAVVLLDKRTRAVTQRIAAAERISSLEFQAWLRHRNAQKHEVYVSMNTLRPEARGRTKSDIESIRHVYLDFDEHGTDAVNRLLNRKDVPCPNTKVSTSPGKWQVAWRVEEFTLAQAEELQKWLARDTGADPAATDAARVLRLPGFYNHKYEPAHAVTAETLNDAIHSPKDFPAREQQLGAPRLVPASNGGPPKSGLSQSERDWAFAKRALARGEPPDLVTLAIAALRRDDKPDPYYYARLTVEKAARQLKTESPPQRMENTEHDR